MAIDRLDAVDLFVVHHSVSDWRTTTADRLRAWHTDPDKPGGPFDDIGYHWVIEGDGRIVAGRRLPLMGAHAPDVNRRSVAVCVVGDNTDPDKAWNERQKLALRHLWYSTRTIFPEIEPRGHFEVMPRGYTECPCVDVRALLLGESSAR